MRSITFVIFVLLPMISLAQQDRTSSVFSPGDHIVLLGNTFADRMRHYGYFETMLQKRFPGYKLRVRNMGWSADEVGLQPAQMVV